jgi:hypothetical protein
MRQARRLLASAAVVASILGAELPAQEPFWIQPFQAPPSSFEEVLASVQFAAIYGNGIRFDLFVLGPEFFQGAAPLTTPTLWSETVASLQGELVTLPIGLGFAPGTFLGLGLTLPSDLTGVRLNSHDLCVNVELPCEVDPGTLPYVVLRAQFPDGLYHSFGPQQMVLFSAAWDETPTVTPEPGSLLLVASGFVGVLAFGRFKKKTGKRARDRRSVNGIAPASR